jgi:hypothetical protein
MAVGDFVDEMLVRHPMSQLQPARETETAVSLSIDVSGPGPAAVAAADLLDLGCKPIESLEIELMQQGTVHKNC